MVIFVVKIRHAIKSCASQTFYRRYFWSDHWSKLFSERSQEVIFRFSERLASTPSSLSRPSSSAHSCELTDGWQLPPCPRSLTRPWFDRLCCFSLTWFWMHPGFGPHLSGIRGGILGGGTRGAASDGRGGGRGGVGRLSTASFNKIKNNK